ncbi:MAG: XRE family transcriptional regulator [Gammaproteobacteria bacterium]|nr:XRE family transcriptional regulator [Gammaproteobacteria bacterium]
MIKSITSKKYLSLLSWLKSARIEQGLTMRDLGVLISEPHQFIGKVESAERRLDLYEYMQYCQALDLDPVDGLILLNKN